MTSEAQQWHDLRDEVYEAMREPTFNTVVRVPIEVNTTIVGPHLRLGDGVEVVRGD